LAIRLKPVAIGNERSLVTNAGMGQIRRGPAAVVGMSAYLGTRAVGAFCSSRRPGACSCAAISESSNISTRSPASAGSGLPEGLDTDADGTVDLAEAKKAAETLFDKLDYDHDGTLDAKELHRMMTESELTAADLDKDGTLSKDEYLAVVEKRFRQADVDHDGTLTPRELRSESGRALLELLQ
jgi:hypothetical protein